MSRKTPLRHVWMVDHLPQTSDRPARSIWTRIGTAVEDDDGSITLTLAAIPVSGRIVLRSDPPAPASTRGAQ